MELWIDTVLPLLWRRGFTTDVTRIGDLGGERVATDHCVLRSGLQKASFTVEKGDTISLVLTSTNGTYSIAEVAVDSSCPKLTVRCTPRVILGVYFTADASVERICGADRR